jgi:NADP-dependent 3-hydroxy acid dehydrogenase YdfG
MAVRKVFLTGATGGIGAALVAKFLADGYSVVAGDVVAARRPGADPADGRFKAIAFDIRDRVACEAAMLEGVDFLGGLDALVNVAGVCYGGDPLSADPTEWAETFDVNVKGMFQLTRAALPHLANSDRADVVNISSIWGVEYNPSLLSYSTSKFAVEGYTGTLRAWGMPKNIRVCAIQVDKVDTGFRRNLGVAGEFPEERLRKMIAPADVASTVSFVLSTSATAQVSSLRLDAPLWYQK